MGPEIGGYIAGGLIRIGILIGVAFCLVVSCAAAGLWWLFHHVSIH